MHILEYLAVYIDAVGLFKGKQSSPWKFI